MQCSKAFCFYSFFIQKHGYWHMTDDEVIKNILEKGLDKSTETEDQILKLPLHENIRGKAYYN
jgi:hypothetical protein